ncbi:polysaccharide biosynthesis protein GumP [Saccharospirillum sp. MSK14-1]|uniref:MBL fold metallo-hydrolase n=1 Tax=Saccharospirillum sp. MSK14-1 TaxID=1897632 RepID=UPI000D372D0B|nr:MBL fold metallo-hydrolase [Saccharospirillum sp. MSK14-1]PTY38811.1 polysaccharide biosynthesis protein GumP [Saccharospirillum sp. MSK14-1]
MSTGVSVRWFESGHCVHPGFMVKPGSGLAPRHFPAGVALVDHPSEGKLLFDTGYHAQFARSTQHFPERFYALVTPHTLAGGDSVKEQLAALDIDASDIRHLVLSHFHGDHVAGICDFDQARLHCHPGGYRFLTERNRLQRLQKGYLRELLPAEAENRLTFTDQFELDLGDILQMDSGPVGLSATDLFNDQLLYLVNLPGHAAGQIGLLVRLQQSFIFFLADACWLIDNLRDGINQHWLANILCDDRRVYVDTLNKLRQCYEQTADRVQFVPSHCQETSQQLLKQGWMR